MIENGVCIRNDDPKGLRRVKIRTARVINGTGWVLPGFGGGITYQIPRVGESVILFSDDEMYNTVFYMVAANTQISGEAVGQRQEKAKDIFDAFEVDINSSVGLFLDGEGDTAQLEAENVTIGTENSTEGIAMRDKIVSFLGTLSTWLDTHFHPTGTGPSGPPTAASPTAAADDIGSTKHKVEP